MSRPVVLVPCSAGKLARPVEAQQLYTGQHHRLAVRAALAVTDPGRVLIVSGRHSLVPLHRRLEPYEAPMRPDGRAELDPDPALVAMAAAAELVVALLPRAYLAHLARIGLAAHCAPLAGLGIGRQRQILARIAAWRVSDLLTA